MSAAANAAAFLSMRRRLPADAGPKPHFEHSPAQAAPAQRPIRVAVLEAPAPAGPVPVSYRKRRAIRREAS